MICCHCWRLQRLRQVILSSSLWTKGLLCVRSYHSILSSSDVADPHSRRPGRLLAGHHDSTQRCSVPARSHISCRGRRLATRIRLTCSGLLRQTRASTDQVERGRRIPLCRGFGYYRRPRNLSATQMGRRRKTHPQWPPDERESLRGVRLIHQARSQARLMGFGCGLHPSSSFGVVYATASHQSHS